MSIINVVQLRNKNLVRVTNCHIQRRLNRALDDRIYHQLREVQDDYHPREWYADQWSHSENTVIGSSGSASSSDLFDDANGDTHYIDIQAIKSVLPLLYPIRNDKCTDIDPLSLVSLTHEQIVLIITLHDMVDDIPGIHMTICVDSDEQKAEILKDIKDLKRASAVSDIGGVAMKFVRKAFADEERKRSGSANGRRAAVYFVPCSDKDMLSHPMIYSDHKVHKHHAGRDTPIHSGRASKVKDESSKRGEVNSPTLLMQTAIGFRYTPSAPIDIPGRTSANNTPKPDIHKDTVTIGSPDKQSEPVHNRAALNNTSYTQPTAGIRFVPRPVPVPFTLVKDNWQYTRVDA